ncbi:MAG: Hsp70 family protein [Oscillibacter sp.]|nr:Hsp70 family protein [Oscillibacter sp.]
MGKELGIDFGTTTTEVSYIDKKGRSRSMRLQGGRAVIPTVLYFNSEDDYIIGQSAAVKGAENPEACVRNFKLDLTNSTKKYRVKAENGDKFSIKPIQAAQFFLNQLIQIVQPKLLREFGETGGTIDRAVITVPAQFDPMEKAAVKDAIEKAAKQAGFSQIKVAAEPTAAAVAYQEENGEDGKTILVYDFGGGTFDVSVIRRKDDLYRELETDGDKRLGGNRLTEKIAAVLWEKCLRETDKDYPFDAEEAEGYSAEDAEEYGLSRARFMLNRTEIFRAAEDMKLDFTESEVSSQTVNFFTDDESDPRMMELHMDEAEFYRIVKADVKKTVDLTRRVLEEMKRRGDADAVDEVVLAGGSSQIRLIQDLLKEYDDLRNLVTASADASTLIARGAALLASKELKTEEKTRFEIGTRIVKGKSLNAFEPLIPVGQSLPCSGSRLYYPAREGQREIAIEYYEKDVKNYPDAKRIDDEGINLVDELTVSGLPDVPNLAVRVTFRIDADGTPSIEAEVVDKEETVVGSGQLLINRKGNLY